jgi:hypothetical protein
MTKNIKPQDKRKLVNAEYALEVKTMANPPRKGEKAHQWYHETVSQWDEFKTRKEVIDALYAKYDQDSVVRFVNKIVEYKGRIKTHIAKERKRILDAYNNKTINDQEAMQASKHLDNIKEQELLNITV